LAVTRDMTLWGFLVLIPFSIFENFNSKIVFFEGFLDWKAVSGLLFLGVLCSSLGYFFWNKALQKLGARYTTNGIYFMPFVTALFEAIFLKNFPGVLTITGGALIIFGLFISEKKKFGKRKCFNTH